MYAVLYFLIDFRSTADADNTCQLTFKKPSRVIPKENDFYAFHQCSEYSKVGTYTYFKI